MSLAPWPTLRRRAERSDRALALLGCSARRIYENGSRGVVLAVDDGLDVLDDVGHVGRALEGFEVVMCCDIGAPELVFDQLLPNDLLRRCSQRFARTDRRRCVPSGGRHHRAPARSSTRSSATARRPDTRRSASAETGGWTPRPFAATSEPRSRFVRPFRPSTVPTTAAGRRSASESALRRP